MKRRGFLMSTLAPMVERLAKAMIPAYSSLGPGNYSVFGTIREPFPGAWQRNMEIEARPNLLAFSAVYACVRLIADDIAKLRIKLMQLTPSGIWVEVDRFSPFATVLRKPNPYQTRVQFLQLWMVTKLLYGNTYVYKKRDNRGLVVGLYCLDPRRVTPLVDDEGNVWYNISLDALNGVTETMPIPASEIIHDRYVTLFHPLVGISPIYACGISATHGLKIQQNSMQFFENMSRPSGHLTSPHAIDDQTSARMKREFELAFTGNKFGKLLVTGGGLKYEAMTIAPEDAQLMEQLNFTGHDVARAFGVPPYKLGLGQNPSFNNITSLNQDYYAQTLQILIEAIEVLLDEGMNLPQNYGTELDLDSLLRMDPVTRAEKNAKGIAAGYLKPNEARASENLEPVKGGDTPYMQQQNYSLAALDARDRNDPFAKPEPAPPADADPAEPGGEKPTDAEAEGNDAATPPDAPEKVEESLNSLQESLRLLNDSQSTMREWLRDKFSEIEKQQPSVTEDSLSALFKQESAALEAKLKTAVSEDDIEFQMWLDIFNAFAEDKNDASVDA